MGDFQKFLEILGIPEVTDKDGLLWKAAFAEFLGNVILNFFGCASCIYISDPNVPVNLVRVALAFGLIVFVVVLSIAHISGGHLNPAVSLAFLVVGKISIIRTLLFIIVQCAGSIAGSGLLMALTPNSASIRQNLGLPSLNSKLTPFQGLCIELLLGFILVLVVFGVTDPNRQLLYIIGPLGVGFTITAGHLAAIDFTGASMNPARALGSAVIANSWNEHWIYWLGPITGGILAALIYYFVFSAPVLDEEDDYDMVPPEEKKEGRV